MGYAFYRLLRGLSRPGGHRPFLAFAAVSVLAGSVAGLADIFDLDATVQVLFWTLLGLVIGTSYAAGEERGQEARGREGSGRGGAGVPWAGETGRPTAGDGRRTTKEFGSAKGSATAPRKRRWPR